MAKATSMEKRKREGAPEDPVAEVTYTPYVDISETPTDIRLTVNLPGVAADSVDVNTESNVLTIQGKSAVEAPKGMSLAGEEFGVGRFRRAFDLSDRVDVSGITARLRDGVLRVVLPKREEARTRKIAITAS